MLKLQFWIISQQMMFAFLVFDVFVHCAALLLYNGNIKSAITFFEKRSKVVILTLHVDN